jgi:hypothetical protein
MPLRRCERKSFSSKLTIGSSAGYVRTPAATTFARSRNVSNPRNSALAGKIQRPIVQMPTYENVKSNTDNRPITGDPAHDPMIIPANAKSIATVNV